MIKTLLLRAGKVLALLVAGGFFYVFFSLAVGFFAGYGAGFTPLPEMSSAGAGVLAGFEAQETFHLPIITASIAAAFSMISVASQKLRR